MDAYSFELVFDLRTVFPGGSSELFNLLLSFQNSGITDTHSHAWLNSLMITYESLRTEILISKSRYIFTFLQF